MICCVFIALHCFSFQTNYNKFIQVQSNSYTAVGFIDDAKAPWEPSLKDSLQAEFQFCVGVAAVKSRSGL